MARTLDELRAETLALPFAERRSLVEDLIESLEDEEDRAFEREHLPEWERRVEEMRSGKVKGVPWEEVKARLIEKYGATEPHPEILKKWLAESDRRYQRLLSGEDKALTLEEFWRDDD